MYGSNVDHKAIDSDADHRAMWILAHRMRTCMDITAAASLCRAVAYLSYRVACDITRNKDMHICTLVDVTDHARSI